MLQGCLSVSSLQEGSVVAQALIKAAFRRLQIVVPKKVEKEHNRSAGVLALCLREERHSGGEQAWVGFEQRARLTSLGDG